MRRVTKIWIGVCTVFVLLVVTIANLSFGVGLPSYKFDEKTQDLVGENTVLKPLAYGISVDVPTSLSLWDRIGFVRGMGAMYKFKYNGKTYVVVHDSALENDRVYLYSNS